MGIQVKIIKLVKEKLIESEVINRDNEFNIDILKSMLNNKFNEINYTDAKEDVIPFIQDVDSLDLWSSVFFIGTTKGLKDKW